MHYPVAPQQFSSRSAYLGDPQHELEEDEVGDEIDVFTALSP